MCFFVLLSAQLSIPWYIQAEGSSIQKNDLINAVKNFGTKKTGISVVNAESGRTVFEYNSKLSLKPASVQKILTSTLVLLRLGPDYKFTTTFRSKRIGKSEVIDLYVQGGGDPDLRTERLWIIVNKLKRLGARSIRDIYLDASAFKNNTKRLGQRAYEAGGSALSFNFNSLMFEICTPARQLFANVKPEPALPSLRLSGQIRISPKGPNRYALDEIPGKNGLVYRLGGTIRPQAKCVELYRSVQKPSLYFGRTIIEYLKMVGITVEGGLRFGRAPASAKLLFKHRSKALDEIVQDLNRYSNNFIAEQLVFALGNKGNGSYDHQGGLRVMTEHLRRLGFSQPEFQIADGSGLSYQNRLSARILTMLLLRVQDELEIKPEFEKSLSVAGKNGTLETRFLSDTALVRAKTGTLNSVSSLSGYLYTNKGVKLAFAIIQNEVTSRSRANLLEKKILGILSKSSI